MSVQINKPFNNNHECYVTTNEQLPTISVNIITSHNSLENKRKYTKTKQSVSSRRVSLLWNRTHY